MHQPQMLSRALNTHNYKKDVTETGCVRERNPSTILGKAQESLFSSKTGIRRLFGGTSKKDLAAALPDEPETMELHEPSRNNSNSSNAVDENAVRMGKIRRSSMTTYTINLGAMGGQAEREVLRLAGLMPPAFGPGGSVNECQTAHGASFDAVEEVDGSSIGRGGDSDDEGQYAFPGGGARGGGAVAGGGGGGGRLPVKSAFSGAPDSNGRVSFVNEAAVHPPAELADVTSMESSSQVPAYDVRQHPRLDKPPSENQSGLSVSPGAATAQASAQLGLMKDRKVPRHTTQDGCSSSPGSGSPATPVGGGSGGAAITGISPSSMLRLPTLLPSTPSRGPSGAQMVHLNSIGSVGESRPGSSRLLLLLQRGVSNNVDRRGSFDPNGASDGSGMNSGGGGTGYGSFASHGTGGGGGAGGRWFQQDTEDMDAMLAGNEDVLQRLMAAGGPYSGNSPRRPLGGEGESGASFSLPRLQEPPQQDRATASLHELHKVQANLADQLNRERQAMATGQRARRASVLEDVAGQHQPRWQTSYNADAPVTHAKLGMVDASRRSELEKAHLTKIVKDTKVQISGAGAVASPVVARARRLSTMMVA